MSDETGEDEDMDSAWAEALDEAAADEAPADGEDEDMDSAWAEALNEAAGDEGGGESGGTDMAALLEDGGGGEGGRPAATVGGRPAAINDINVDLTAVLGTAEMKVSNLLKIGRGAVIELDRRVGDAIEIRVSGTAVARGDVVVVEDRLAVSITEIVKKS